MVLIKDINLNNSFSKEISKSCGNFQTGTSSKTLKSIEFFEELYSYPPKFKIKNSRVTLNCFIYLSLRTSMFFRI